MTFPPPDLQLFRDVNGLARRTGWLHAPMLDYATYGLVLFAALLVTGCAGSLERCASSPPTTP